MRRLIAILLLVSVTSGCSAMTRQRRATAALADLSAVSGLLLVAKNAGCQTRSPMRDEYGLPTEVTAFDCVGEDLAVGAGVVLLGIGALIGATLLVDEAASPRAEQVGGPVVTVTPAPPMPDLPTARVDDRTLQFAKQARRSAANGDCDATRRMLTLIAHRDPGYHASLAVSPAVAACR